MTGLFYVWAILAVFAVLSVIGWAIERSDGE